jgi:hypothetical protein
MMKVTAFRASDNIESSTNLFYNTSHFSTYSTPLGSVNKILRPHTADSIRIKIDNALGNELFNFYKTNAREVTDTAVFKDYFRGIKLQTDIASTNVIAAFKNTGFALRMYYHTDVGIVLNKHVDFSSGNTAREFYSVNVDRTGTILSPLDNTAEIDASMLGNKFYLQNLTGIKTRINFPSINTILKQATFVKILAAELQIKPDAVSTSKYPLPSSMYLYYRDIGNGIYGPMYSSDGSTVQSGALYIDQLYAKDTRYVYSLLDYVNNELTTNIYTTRSLVPLPVADLTRLVAGTTSNSNYPTKLVVSTLTYQN